MNDIAFSLDGRQLASCSTDGTVRVWDCMTGTDEVIHRVEPSPLNEFAEVRFVNSTGLLVRPRYRGLQAWDTGTRTQVATLVNEAHAVRGFTVHPAGRLVAAYEVQWSSEIPSLPSLCVRVWSTLNWALIDQHRVPYGYAVSGLAFDPTGTRLATATGVIDSRSGLLLSEAGFPGETLLWSPDGRFIAGHGSAGKAVCVYEAKSAKFVGSVSAGTKEVQDFAFSADGLQFVVASNEETVRVWNTRTWEEAPALAWGVGKLKCVAFFPDGTRAACGSHRGKIVMWDLD